MTASPADITAQRAALFSHTDTAQLVIALETLDAIERPTAEQRMVYAWTADEITRRLPEVDALVELAMEQDDDPRTYCRIITDAIATLAATDSQECQACGAEAGEECRQHCTARPEL